jgi:hypothetical protein
VSLLAIDRAAVTGITAQDQGFEHCALAAAFDRGTMSRLSTETP